MSVADRLAELATALTHASAHVTPTKTRASQIAVHRVKDIADELKALATAAEAYEGTGALLRISEAEKATLQEQQAQYIALLREVIPEADIKPGYEWVFIHTAIYTLLRERETRDRRCDPGGIA